jgi:hypothetical protein
MNAQIEFFLSYLENQPIEWQSEIDRIREALSTYENALRFYRDSFSFNVESLGHGLQTSEWVPKAALLDDCGNMALAALETTDQIGTTPRMTASQVAILKSCLAPFAKVAEFDIGHNEADEDVFQPMSSHNRVPKITVGDMRRALAAFQSET